MLDRVSVVEAVTRDLESFPVELRESGLAAVALSLAAEMDDSRNSATSKSMCAGKLTDALEKLAALKPPEKEANRLDDLTRRREQRRSAGGAVS